MSKLRISTIEENKPVTMTIKLSPEIYRDLILYAELMKRERGKPVEPNSLVVPMLARFMAAIELSLRPDATFRTKTDSVLSEGR